MKTYSDVTIKMTEISSKDPTINQVTYVPEGNQIPQVRQEIVTNMFKGNQITRIPCQHLNHWSIHLH